MIARFLLAMEVALQFEVNIPASENIYHAIDHFSALVNPAASKRFSQRPVFIAGIAALCVAGVARAEDASKASYEGRWVAEKSKLTLDVSRCGSGYCAVEVADGSACGRTVLRVSPGTRRGTRDELTGRLELTLGAQHFTVVMDLIEPRDNAPAKLWIGGHSGDEISLMRRTFDYQNVFVRAGDAACKPQVS